MSAQPGVVYTRTNADPLTWVAAGRDSLVIGEWAVPEALVAGSAPIGTSNYTPPASNVLYVSPGGNDGNSGTVGSPLQTLDAAIDAAATGDTIVLRSGTYHESVTVPSTKALTVQAYPGETVWFDGSSTYASWSGSGPWTASLSFSWSAIDSSGYNQEGDGRANLPEQVWIDGVAQTQIADNGTPTSGQFSVNRTTDVISIGTNPAGKEVRVADLRYWMVAAGRVTLRGFGVRRYSPSMVESVESALIYVAGTADNSVIENMIFKESGMHGLAITRTVSLTNVTIEECNNAGIEVTTSNNSVLSKFVIRNCNLGVWQREPITAGIKITRTDGIVIRDGVVDHVTGAFGVWFDVSCTRFTVANVSVNDTDIAFEAELSGGGFYSGEQHHSWFINCRSYNVVDWSMKIFDSDYVTIANCDLAAGRVPFNYQQDERYNTGTPGNMTFEIVPWVSGHNRMWNNKIVGSPSIASMIAYHDAPTPVPSPEGGGNVIILGWDFFDEIEGNWVPDAPPGSMIQMGKVDGTRTSYNTWALAAAAPSSVGGPPGAKLSTNHQGASAPSDSIAVPLPDDISDLLGVPRGFQRVGTILLEPTVSF